MSKGQVKCDYHFICDCNKQSFREMRADIDRLELAAIELSRFANAIPTAIILAEYISWEDRNRLWDDIVRHMPHQAQDTYKNRLKEILKENENVL